MQNTNSKLNTILIIIVILILGYIAFLKPTGSNNNYNPLPYYPDNNSEQEKDNYPDQTPEPQSRVYTIPELIKEENLAGVTCETNLITVVREFTITGYLNPSDVQTSLKDNRINMWSSSSSINAEVFDLHFASNSNSNINKIIQKYNQNNSQWIHIKVHGALLWSPRPINGSCVTGYYLSTDNVTILD